MELVSRALSLAVFASSDPAVTMVDMMMAEAYVDVYLVWWWRWNRIDQIFAATELGLDSAVVVAMDLRALSLTTLSWWQWCHQIRRYQ